MASDGDVVVLIRGQWCWSVAIDVVAPEQKRKMLLASLVIEHIRNDLASLKRQTDEQNWNELSSGRDDTVVSQAGLPVQCVYLLETRGLQAELRDERQKAIQTSSVLYTANFSLKRRQKHMRVLNWLPPRAPVSPPDWPP